MNLDEIGDYIKKYNCLCKTLMEFRGYHTMMDELIIRPAKNIREAKKRY